MTTRSRHSEWTIELERLNFPYPQLYPELELFGNRSEQEQNLRACNGYVPWWLGVLTGIALGWLMRDVMRHIVAEYLGITGVFQELLQALISATLVLACLFGLLHLRALKVRRALRQILADRGVEICVHCGYDLRGSSDLCPECGKLINR